MKIAPPGSWGLPMNRTVARIAMARGAVVQTKTGCLDHHRALYRIFGPQVERQVERGDWWRPSRFPADPTLEWEIVERWVEAPWWSSVVFMVQNREIVAKWCKFNESFWYDKSVPEEDPDVDGMILYFDFSTHRWRIPVDVTS